MKNFSRQKNIQDSFITERLGDIGAQRELSKFFKPITDTQKDIKESLVKEIKPITEGIKKIPAAITFPQLQLSHQLQTKKKMKRRKV